MKIISHIICPGNSVVAVINRKKGDLLLLYVGFGQIGDNANPVLVKGQQRSRMRVSRVRLDNSITFRGYFGLVDNQLVAHPRLFLLLGIFERHFELTRIMELELRLDKGRSFIELLP